MKTKSEITKENILIAEFMQVDKNDNGSYEIPQYGTLLTNGDFKTEFLENRLEYHVNYNWLMEVVEKLENSGVQIFIGRMFCEIKYDDLFDKNKKFDKKIVSGVKINSIHGAIIESIKWYNENR